MALPSDSRSLAVAAIAIGVGGTAGYALFAPRPPSGVEMAGFFAVAAAVGAGATLAFGRYTGGDS